MTQALEAPYDVMTNGTWSGLAWRTAACRMGYDCGPESPMMVERCVGGLVCEGKSYEEDMRGMLGSDAEREAVEKNVQAVLATIEA